jgi:uncharacterized membrane protein YbhN (UPF0104 family)
MSQLRTRIRTLLIRHLYMYLAAIIALAGILVTIFARDEIVDAVNHLERRWIPLILLLSVFNYALRFIKWHQMLRAVRAPIDLRSSARIYFACFAMVVTPLRLGELYKLVFLKRLHGIGVRQSGPVLVVERLTDVVAVLALSAWWFDRNYVFPFAFSGIIILALLAGSLAGRERPRALLVGLMNRLPYLSARSAALSVALANNSVLLRPQVLGPVILWSILAWWSECVGLYFILFGLDAPISLADATWIYAVATTLGNMAFFPGGLGGTEGLLILYLGNLGLGREITVPATFLVRAATLWFAVGLGLLVTLTGRKALRWEEIRENAENLDDIEGDWPPDAQQSPGDAS